MKLKRFILSRSGQVLLIALLVAFVHGLLFIFFIPPWQHSDEPNHFEYAWLFANRGTRPQPGDYDQTMRREVAVSMINHGFFRGLNFLPDLQSENQPIWIGGYSQLSNPPLYYAVAAIPLRLLSDQSVTRQLYAIRLVSLLFLLCTVLAAWGITVELTRPCNPLRLLVPLTLALLPGFVDLMTSVNSDAGAVALFSLALWGSVRIIHRGIALLPVLFTALAVGLCFLVKETAYFALMIFILALLLALSQPGVGWSASSDPACITPIPLLG
jgi:4-amino-4-deoxy-L-arabinose transferase-like glycosyltransferase